MQTTQTTQTTQRKTSLFRTVNRPYYIWAPDYRDTSSGIRVLHLLCHALNRIGEEAYLTTTVTNHALRTPTVDAETVRRHAESGREPIVVYPEVVHGNPLGGNAVVRYLLNKPGFLGGDREYDASEIIVAYKHEFVPDDMACEMRLFVPSEDPEIFFAPPEGGPPRRGSYYYAYRYLANGYALSDMTQQAEPLTQEDPRSLEELGDLFRGAERLYCYEGGALAFEARLCGCPVVFVPNPYLGEIPDQELYGLAGAAWGDSEEQLAHAKATVGEVAVRYEALRDGFRDELAKFVALTQEFAHGRYAAVGDAGITLPGAQSQPTARERASNAYRDWCAKHELTESAAQYMAERMMLDWRARPSFHLVVVVARGEEEALADTIDSLAVQFYKEWGLSILAAEAPPPGWESLPNVEWLECDGPALEAINTVVTQSGADWFVRLEAGVRLAPEALFSWVDHLNLHPTWKLIYSDEDSIDAAGDRCDPLFKPDFNLDLLRSMPFLGDVLPVEGGILRTLGGFSGPEGALSYDLALRVLDVAGAQAIGHVPKVLVHRPRRFTRARDPLVVANARCEALASHLARCGVQATVGSGVLPDTFCLEYPTNGRPRASIVVVERPAGSAVAECVGSILQRTTYPDFEVVVVRGTPTSDLPPDPRVRTVMGVGSTLAQRCNAGAAAATGEFLVFLDNEAHVAHEDWLTRLIANGQRPGVGIVGGRIVDASQRVVHAGFVLGLHGTVGSPGRGERLDAPGYMDRLQVAQDLAAVSGACLLIRRALFESLGGMDDVRFPELFADVDLCLRTAERSLRTVWTPFVTLLGEPRRLAVDSAGAAAEREALYGRWLPRLTADPAHNRHLSLTDPDVVVEAEVDPTWEEPFRPRPRVLAFPLDACASGHYRVWGPLQALDRGARAQCSLLPIHGMHSTQTRVPNLPELLRADPDTLLVQHGYFDLFLDWLKRYRAHSKSLIVFGQDDNLLDVPDKNSLRGLLLGDLERRLTEALSCCDRLIVTTEPLVDVYRRFIDDVRVVPNHLDGVRWGALRSLRRAGRKPRVGWAGAMQHLGDLDWLEPVVSALSDEVEWVFMGMCPPELRPHVTEFRGPVPFEHYPAALATLNLDLAIAPLEIHPFNEGKSDLRILEYGALGWPVIATDIYPYQGKPVTCLPNDPGRWIAAIRERVNDLDALAAEGDRLRDWVLGTRTIERNLDAWMQALFSDEVLRASRPPPALAA